MAIDIKKKRQFKLDGFIKLLKFISFGRFLSISASFAVTKNYTGNHIAYSQSK